MLNQGAALIAGIVQDQRNGHSQFQGGELVQQGTDRGGSDVTVMSDHNQVMSDGVQRGQDIKALPTGWGLKEDVGKAPQKAQKRGQDEMSRIHKEDGSLTSLGVVQPGVELLVQELGLLLGVSFGRDAAHLTTFHTHLLEKLLDLGNTPFEASQLFNLGPGFLETGARLLLKIFL